MRSSHTARTERCRRRCATVRSQRTQPYRSGSSAVRSFLGNFSGTFNAVDECVHPYPVAFFIFPPIPSCLFPSSLHPSVLLPFILVQSSHPSSFQFKSIFFNAVEKIDGAGHPRRRTVRIRAGDRVQSRRRRRRVDRGLGRQATRACRAFRRRRVPHSTAGDFDDALANSS